MIDLERRILEAIALQSDKSDGGTVNPDVVRRALRASPEGMERALRSLERQDFVGLDNNNGSVTIANAGREALSGGA